MDRRADPARRGLAKLSRPRLYATHPRERLHLLLDRARQCPLVFIAAPPGAGKTTLVASYVEARQAPALWLQLDRGDDDPASFFYYLRRAAVALLPRKRLRLPLMSAEFLGDLSIYAQRWFRELADALPEGALLVLDNYQAIDPSAPLHAIVGQAAAELAGRAAVVMISRDEPPPAFAAQEATRQLARLVWDELRLTDDEARAIAQADGPGLDGDALAALLRQCNGWAAGVVLMLERYRRTGSVNAIDRRETMETVFDYFAGLIFDDASAAERATLMAAAHLPHMSAALLGALTDDPNAGRLLERLYQRHLFTERRLNPRATYQFHALFRAFLSSQAERNLTIEARRALEHRAALLLEQDGQLDAAVELMQRVGDADGIARIACGAAPALIAHGRNRLLLQWLARLPEERFEADAWLSYWRGYALLPIEPQRTVQDCGRAFERFRASGERAGALLSWAWIANAFFYNRAPDLRQLDRWIAVADALLRTDAGFPSEDCEYKFLGSLYKALHVRCPTHPLHEGCRQRLVALGLSGRDAGNRCYHAYVTVIFETQRGRLLQARTTLEACDRVPELPALSESISHLARIVWQVEVGEGVPALATMHRALRRAREVGIPTWTHFLHWHGARAALLLGRCDEAEAICEQFSRDADTSRGVAAFLYHHALGWLALRRGALPTAAVHAACAIEAAQAVDWPLFEARMHQLRARIVWAQGDGAEARREVRLMQSLAERLDNDVLLCQAALLGALVETDATAASPLLARGWRLAREMNLVHTLWLCPEDGGVLCAAALSQGIEMLFVGEVVRRLALSPPTTAPSEWPWPLRIRVLGGFDVEVAGEPLRFDRKPPRKVLALLKLLIARGAQGVAIDDIADTLWPELDGDAARQAMEAALHRLRRLLVVADAVRLSDGAVSLDARLCWVDALAFERAVQAAEAGPCLDDRERARREALSLYRGPLLPTDAAEASYFMPRQRLQARYERLAQGAQAA